MTFRHLYNHVCDLVPANIAGGEAPVSIAQVTKFILDSKEVETISVHGVDLHKTLGHIIIYDDRSSPYDGPEYHAHIRFLESLNKCWARFVTCKEMMHVYDEPGERTGTRDDFYKLIRDIQNQVMKDDISPLLNSEFKAEWMALTLLCPKDMRESFKEKLQNRAVTTLQVATELQIPERIIPAIMDDYYDEALERFLRMPPALGLVEGI